MKNGRNQGRGTKSRAFGVRATLSFATGCRWTWIEDAPRAIVDPKRSAATWFVGNAW